MKELYTILKEQYGELVGPYCTSDTDKNAIWDIRFDIMVGAVKITIIHKKYSDFLGIMFEQVFYGLCESLTWNATPQQAKQLVDLMYAINSNKNGNV